MKVYSIAGIILTGSVALFSFFFIPLQGIFGYVVALCLANLITSIYTFLSIGAYKYFTIKSFRSITCVEMLKYSFPLVPNAVMWWLLYTLNRPLIESHLGMHEVGIFAVASKFPTILNFLLAIFSTSWQISVIEEFNLNGYAFFFNKILRYAVFFFIMLACIISLGSKLLVSLFATDEFINAWKYIPILTLGAVFSCVASLIGSNFSAVRKSKYYLWSSIYSSLTAIILNIILIPKYGLIGASIAILFSCIVLVISRIIYAKKYVEITHKIQYFCMIIAYSCIILSLLLIDNIFILYTICSLLFVTIIVINYDMKEDIMNMINMKQKITGRK
jgi:O-antigen/teichoic acid export membrane protein